MSTNPTSPAQRDLGFPRLNLPLGGVAFGMLWVIGAFATLITCFQSNFRNTPVLPSEELAIANAALSPAHPSAEHRAGETPTP